MKTTFGGAGVGATYAWEGNDAVGAGKMTIADLKPNEAVGITLEFQRPTASTNRTEFLLAPQDQGTKVTWRMLGHNGFMGKAFTLVMNIDQLVGKDFDRGLGQLKALAEGAAAAEAAKTAPPPEASPDAADASDAGTP
jgi:hypothetical protein